MQGRAFGILLAAGLSGTLIAACSSGGGGGGTGAGPGVGGGVGSGGTGAAPGVGGSGAVSAGGSSGDGGSAGSAGSGAGGSGGTPTNPGDPGSPCTDNSQCNGGADAECLTDAAGWPGGYCVINNCSAGSCPAGSECFETTSGATLCLKTCAQKNDCGAAYACHAAGACVPGCTPSDCEAGEVCNANTGLCEAAPCTTGSCPSGLVCDTGSGKCIPDSTTGPGPGPGPDCTGKLPKRDCVGTAAYCGELSSFEPKLGAGYEDYPLNGETSTNQYRSYARRDMQMLIKYAAAYVDCKAKSWNTGNGGLIGLGDMSEANGAIPGTSVGQPGHPQGTHVNGFDMDIAYFQAGTVDNKLRPVCPHTSGGQDQYHCVGAPDKLDVWRSALFLGAMFTSETVRVIGVDGQVGPLVEQSMLSLCASQWLPQYACDNMQGKFGAAKQYGLTYETVDNGYGWYYFHHHHLHISLNGKVPTNPSAIAPEFGGTGGTLRTQAEINPLLELAGRGDGHDHGILRRIGKLPLGR